MQAFGASSSWTDQANQLIAALQESGCDAAAQPDTPFDACAGEDALDAGAPEAAAAAQGFAAMAALSPSALPGAVARFAPRASYMQQEREQEACGNLTCVGVVGLGLIGGSFAKAYADAGMRVLAYDIDDRSLEAACAEGSVAGVLDEETAAQCQLIVVALYPQATIAWMQSMGAHIASDTLVIDCGGVKRSVCPVCFAIAERCGFTFIGGHPMAGTHHSGFRYARADLFAGQPMVLVPPEVYDPSIIARAERVLSLVGFGSFSVTTPGKHDQLIAYTSQLAHIVSSAFVKSPTAQKHKGFSAGSYKDLTRVAELNADMWTELFMDNADNLAQELDNVIGELERYRTALACGNETLLHDLLEEGTIAKQKADGRYADVRAVEVQS